MSSTETIFAFAAGLVGGSIWTSAYCKVKMNHVDQIHRFKEQRDYNRKQSEYFKNHEATKRRYEIEAQVYQEAIDKEKELLKRPWSTLFGQGGYIPDIEREAAERWMAEQAQ